MATEFIEVPVIADVVGGHAGKLDDFKGGVESIIRLRPEFPVETLRGIEEFSHLQVTWFFNLGSPDDVALHARSPATTPPGRPPGPSCTTTTGARPGSRPLSEAAQGRRA